MENVKKISDYVGSRDKKFYKTTLFSSENLLLGLNCLEPGQIQEPHDHANQDKFYLLIEGTGLFWLGDERIAVSTGQVIWAPAGMKHGVENVDSDRLVMLVGISPAP